MSIKIRHKNCLVIKYYFFQLPHSKPASSNKLVHKKLESNTLLSTASRVSAPFVYFLSQVAHTIKEEVKKTRETPLTQQTIVLYDENRRISQKSTFSSVMRQSTA